MGIDLANLTVNLELILVAVAICGFFWRLESRTARLAETQQEMIAILKEMQAESRKRLETAGRITDALGDLGKAIEEMRRTNSQEHKDGRDVVLAIKESLSAMNATLTAHVNAEAATRKADG